MLGHQIAPDPNGDVRVLVLRNGQLHGGDAHVYYSGNCECSGGHWHGKMTSQEHTPTTRPISATVQHIGFLGTYDEIGAKVQAMALVGERSIRCNAKLRMLVAI